MYEYTGTYYYVIMLLDSCYRSKFLKTKKNFKTMYPDCDLVIEIKYY